MCITTYMPSGIINYAALMDIVKPGAYASDHDTVCESVRRFCTERLYELERALRPMVDNTFGEVAPGHLQGYLGVIKELGRMYQTAKPPRDAANLVPMDKVQQLLAGMREQHARELDEAVAATQARVLAEVASGRQLSVQAARAMVATRLLELEHRGK